MYFTLREGLPFWPGSWNEETHTADPQPAEINLGYRKPQGWFFDFGVGCHGRRAEQFKD